MNLNELEKLADAALETEALDVNEDISIHASTSWSRTQRGFIAAANPQQIKAMIAVMRQMAGALMYYDFANGVPQQALAAYDLLMKGEWE